MTQPSTPKPGAGAGKPSHRSAQRPARTPEQEDERRGLAIALIAHAAIAAVMLVGFLTASPSNPNPVQIELWAEGDTLAAAEPEPQPDTPEPAAEPAPQPEPEPQPAPQPEPQPQPQPEPPPQAEPPPPPEVDPDIAIEKAREERRKREEEEQRRLVEQKKAAEEKAKAEKAAAEKAAAEKAAAAKKAAAEKKAKEEQAKRDAIRAAMRGDALGAAGIAGGTADRNQSGGGGADSGYAALVRKCIRDGVVYPTPPRNGPNPTVQYRANLDGSGHVTGVRILRSSGIPAFDRAVESGIRACNPFPKPPTGKYPAYVDGNYLMYDQ